MRYKNPDLHLVMIWLAVFEILSMEKSNLFAPHLGINFITADLRQIAQRSVRFWYENYRFHSVDWWRTFREIVRLDKQTAREVYNFGNLFLENYPEESSEIMQWGYFFNRLVRRRPGNQLLRLPPRKKQALKNAYLQYQQRLQHIFSLRDDVIKLPLSEWEQYLFANYKGGSPLNLLVGQACFWSQVSFWREIEEILSPEEMKRLEEWAAMIVDKYKFNFDRKPRIISFDDHFVPTGS